MIFTLQKVHPLRGRACEFRTKSKTPNGVKPLITMGATHGKRISQSEPHDPEWVEQYQIETLDYHLRSPNYQFRTHTYQLKAAMDQKEAHNYHLGMNSERLIGDIEQL